MALQGRISKGLALATLSLISQNALAKDALVVMPNCLQQAMVSSHTLSASDENYSLVKLSKQDLNQLALTAHKKHCGHFFNVSDETQARTQPKAFLASFNVKKPSKVKQFSLKSNQANSELTKKLIVKVCKKRIWDNLKTFTSFNDRYSNGNNGVKAAEWLKNTFLAMADEAKRDDVETYFVKTGNDYIQSSLVTVVGKDKKGEALVLGAHMDTLSAYYSHNNRMPGADDDGSGSMSLMETARIILNAEKFDRPIYFIWYAAEEMGLYGSKYVVRHFVKNQIPVKSVLQFDMTGYRRNGSDKMWMIGDHVDRKLSEFVESLIKQYIGVDVGWTKCNYACSDHASWTQQGYASAFPVESKFGQEDPNIHTGRDTMDLVSQDHMANFSKLGIAFITEQVG